MAVELAEPVMDLAIVFIIIGGFLLISNKLSLPSVPIFILAGIIAGFFIEQENIFELARWGVAFLVFAFGVSVDFKEIKAVLWESEYAVSIQILIIGSLSIIIGLMIGFDHINSLYFAAAVILSSTMVGFKLAGHEGKTRLVRGRLSETIQFTDDILAVFLILFLGAVSIRGLTPIPILRNLIIGIILLVIAMLIYNYGFEYIVSLAGDSEELSLMSSISLLIIFISISEYFGISIAVGAFIAGLAVKIEPVKSTELLNGVESIKYFFSAIFFAMLGGLLTLPSLQTVLISLVLVLLVVFIKPFFTILILLWEGFDIRTSALTGFRLNQMSEFTLIIAIEGLLLGIIILELFDAIILAVVVTMIISSITIRKEEQIFGKIFKRMVDKYPAKRIDDKSVVQPGLKNHTIILGYGRQGKKLVEICRSKGFDFLVIEDDPVKLEELDEECENYVFGDAMHDYTWEKASINNAKVVISTIDRDIVSQKLLEMDVHCPVVPKAHTMEKTREYFEKGALYVNNPNILVSRYLIEKINEEVVQD